VAVLGFSSVCFFPSQFSFASLLVDPLLSSLRQARSIHFVNHNSKYLLSVQFHVQATTANMKGIGAITLTLAALATHAAAAVAPRFSHQATEIVAEEQRRSVVGKHAEVGG
jgi:hypothetical protein